MMMSKTVLMSAGDPLITRRMSAVASCCASSSATSRSRSLDLRVRSESRFFRSGVGSCEPLALPRDTQSLLLHARVLRDLFPLREVGRNQLAHFGGRADVHFRAVDGKSLRG